MPACWRGPRSTTVRFSFDGLPVPGATVTVTQGAKRFETVTDLQGLYEFPDLADGPWKIQIEMRGFSTLKSQVTVAPNMPQGAWELKLLGLAQMLAKTPVSQPDQPPSASVAEAKPKPEKAAEPQVQPHSGSDRRERFEWVGDQRQREQRSHFASTQFRRPSAIGGRAPEACTRAVSVPLWATRSSMRGRIR